MTRPRVVAIDTRCRAAWPSLPGALPAYAVFVTDTGERLRIEPDGSVSPVVAHGMKSIASDPTAVRP